MNDAGVRKHLAGSEAHVRWDGLSKLEIRVSTSPGRVLPEWVMTDLTGDQLSFPMPEEPEGFLARVQTLPGFQDGQFLAACKATHAATYTCWEQTPAPV